MTHVVLSLPAIVIATIVVGIPLKLDAWRHAQCVSTHRDCRGQRTYRPLARCTALHFQRTRAGDVCCAPALLQTGSWQTVANIARQGFSGHHFVIMALCSMVAAFLVNTFFAWATRSRHPLTS